MLPVRANRRQVRQLQRTSQHGALPAQLEGDRVRALLPGVQSETGRSEMSRIREWRAEKGRPASKIDRCVESGAKLIR